MERIVMNQKEQILKIIEEYTQQKIDDAEQLIDSKSQSVASLVLAQVQMLRSLHFYIVKGVK